MKINEERLIRYLDKRVETLEEEIKHFQTEIDVRIAEKHLIELIISEDDLLTI
jgi:hypothetical protein